MKDNVVLEKAFAFGLRIVNLYRYLVEQKKEFVLSKELLIAGTGIGKHVNEAVFAESRQVFVMEFGTARRRSADTDYWLRLLLHSGLITDQQFQSIDADRVEVTKVINAIRASTKSNDQSVD